MFQPPPSILTPPRSSALSDRAACTAISVSGTYEGHLIGTPYEVVSGSQPPVSIKVTEYPAESDSGPMPIPWNAPVEGDPSPAPGSDRHVMILDNGNCWLYEMFDSFLQGNGSWNAGTSAVWDLTTNEQRPWTWTSADAAGTPLFPGMVRYDEVAGGSINHALEYTLQYTRDAFTPPASHFAGTSTNQLAAPMGMRMRLKAGFDISPYPADVRVILKALKTYGMILVDNGAPMFLNGTPDQRWNNDHIGMLRQVTAADFDVLLISPLYTESNYPRGANPTIHSFTATASGGSGQPVTLRWNVANGEYYIVSPSVGALRGVSVVVYPRVTTTYTLNAANAYGRSTATVTITVR